MPQGEKKIAILFNTMPGNAKIGCAEGLDTFESVRRSLLDGNVFIGLQPSWAFGEKASEL